MNNDSNEFRKMKTNSANQDNINMQLLSTMSMKTKDDLKLGHINKKSQYQKKKKIRLEDYQEVSK